MSEVMTRSYIRFFIEGSSLQNKIQVEEYTPWNAPKRLMNGENLFEIIPDLSKESSLICANGSIKDLVYFVFGVSNSYGDDLPYNSLEFRERKGRKTDQKFEKGLFIPEYQVKKRLTTQSGKLFEDIWHKNGKEILLDPEQHYVLKEEQLIMINKQQLF